MLEYLNKTIFYQLTETDNFNSNLRKEFLHHYNKIINILVRFNKGNDLLEVLYFLPQLAFQHLDDTNLWDIVDNMLENPITNAGLNKEDIMVKLLTAIHQNSRTDQIFLLELLKQNRKKKTRLELLIYRLDGENNTKLIKLLYDVWKRSDFTLPDEKQNPMFKDTNGLLFLPYESEKWAGFYFSNADVVFAKGEIKVDYETGNYEDVEIDNPKFASGKGNVKREIVDHFTYHPFYPIYIKNVDKQDTLLILKPLYLPLFCMPMRTRSFGTISLRLASTR